MKTNGTWQCTGLFIVIFTFICNASRAQLKADFTADVQSGCSPLIVNFKDISKGLPTDYIWNLGNGTISTKSNPTATYFDPGTYTIRLIIKNAAGLDSITKTSFITVYKHPAASFSASPTEGCFPLNVKFTSNSAAGSGNIINYLWDYGDGNIDSIQKGSHIYLSEGIFNITLKVTNTYGCTNTITKDSLVKINSGVSAGFKLTSIDACKAPAVAVFENTSEGTGTLQYNWNFGDSKTSTEKSPSHNYAASGSYNVSLTVKSSAGCANTANLPLNVHFPVTSFSNTSATCLNQAIHFTNNSTPVPVSSTWYFSDGSTSKDINPDKTFTQPGTYSVKLVNVFSEGCTDSATKQVVIAVSPAASFSADNTMKCSVPFTVNFTNKTTGSATAYLWDFGDGTTSAAVNPSHIYSKQGNFTVTLVATNANGCTNTFQQNNFINIQPVKITGLINLPDSGCAPLLEKPTVRINVNYPIKSYSWDFGDGFTSTAQSPSHTYTKEGIYTIKATIVTEDGCTSTYTLPKGVAVGHRPKAGILILKDTICANGTAVFQNASTNGPLTSLNWDYGNVYDSVRGRIYNKHPLDTGYIPVSLIATNNGCSDTLDKPKAIYSLPPVAKINVATNCTDRQKVVFTDKSIVDITRKWDFGDGLTDATANPEHTYTNPGNYRVTLYTQNKSCYDTAYAIVRVINEIGTLTLPNSVFCRGNNFTADIANINPDNIRYTTWDFGDGIVITVNGATKCDYAYTIAGRFKVKATVIDKNNCQYLYETKDSVTVYGPLASFVSAATATCLQNSIAFTDKSTDDGNHKITKWTWRFEEGALAQNYTNNTAITHRYADTGYKTVVLSVTDTYGCTDSSKRNNYVYISQPTALFSVSDSIACPGKQITFQNNSAGRGLAYVWDFGDGTKSTQANPAFDYKKSGIYNPVLYVTDAVGCKDTFHINNIKVSKPVANFSLSDSVSSCPPLQVNFTNKSSDFTAVSWNFGDGSPSVLESPAHLYTYPGKYPVKLIVKGYGSCADTADIKNIVIKGPTGTMQYDNSPLCYPNPTQFSAVSKNVVQFTWDFSDGNTISTPNNKAAHAYQPGNYLPKLILQDAEGCKVSIKGPDTLKIFGVTAKAEITGSTSCKLKPVVFNDVSFSNDIIKHYYWAFGDDSIADQKTATHYYTQEGSFMASLITVTKLGCRDTFNFSTPVKVLPKPEISIVGAATACASATVSFTGKALPTDDIASWSWNFNNGKTANGATATTIFGEGKYSVGLVATNAGGCSDTAAFPVVVNPAPTIKAVSDTIVCQGGPYQLKATGANTYSWFGNGLSCSDCAAPIINPVAASTYYVTGKNSFGCINSDSVNISIVTPTTITVSNTDTLCVGEKVTLNATGANTYQWYPALYLDNDKSNQPIFTAVRDTTIRYRVIGHTAYNCFADTGYVSIKTYPIPTFKLEHTDVMLSVGSTVQLHANSSPDITSWRWSPPQGLSSVSIADPIASPIQSTTYSCIASNGGSCIARDAITVNVICGNSNVYIPNTFSPNKDGTNDVFYPRGKGLFKIKSFRVFNRWGQIVFDKANASPNNEADGWNGTFNGKPLQPDVYVYIIEVLCANNFVIPFKGNVTLLR